MPDSFGVLLADCADPFWLVQQNEPLNSPSRPSSSFQVSEATARWKNGAEQREELQDDLERTT